MIPEQLLRRLHQQWEMVYVRRPISCARLQPCRKQSDYLRRYQGLGHVRAPLEVLKERLFSLPISEIQFEEWVYSGEVLVHNNGHYCSRFINEVVSHENVHI